MTIDDRVYGSAEVNSNVLLDLINSQPVQRLKGIAQFGIPDEFYHKQNYSRYEHSVGVMILLQRLGASEEEQIAGLLHDVSHTAFSHVID
ncbi:MAG TPA: HD domain-containing protein [Verrucomicrobiae bacterium]|nr:HD domain-containing protein [Verrucomicrobiae bacterium]